MSGTTIIGHGTTFAIGATPVTIAGCVSVDFGSDKVDALDSTDMLTAGITRVYQGGLEAPGDCTVKFNYLPGDTSQAALYAAKDGTIKEFTVTYPSAVAVETFNGIITSVTKNVPDEKLATLTVKIQISGARTLA